MAADAAVAELRRRNAGTYVGPVRRVVRFAPLLAFALVVVAGTVGITSFLEAAMLTEPLAEGTVSVVGGVAVLVAAGLATWGVWAVTTPDLPMPVTVPGVVELDDAVLGWVTDETPAPDVWRLNEAVSSYTEFVEATWTVEDLLHGYVDADGDGELEFVGDPALRLDSPLDGGVDAPALVALRSAIRDAAEALRAVAGPLGFEVDRVLTRDDVA
ncbi:hypothetical protein [Frigoribacterium sp. MEB024]|uniref:hypothetical protein n=1 Tax=Frigoribacterium sp. MEB024 TaxID=1589899 RepID=UPI0012E025FD|nr:hypothetical protein [Frigoribacterium sp. MEB024]